ncbi:aspartyl-tRNA(Asn)/glutamyl-tRNA(Gln) amidotransferase subunit A [Metamycoplasma subdolum]|uniref:Aspartyl-tRNA(Asn)/glutamyl-tRNA(Gln) amidotransferase subunit A n=1 Tax=Metamycoplasma subdolum TaxID=92407 RepID=A0A3L9ZYF7_9BACT|nr:amidase family protein [Metamycoplasma subdolum]RMA77480.1 aspartyl-tRNA(Asn)/glutamyl-tRNA(Gln) amidotransferase subunit A [Metamycoplasma subdolum]WPB50679.1 amidase family protein [Metamycoplasma subdolum]
MKHNKTDLKKALKNLLEDKNHAISYVYKDAKLKDQGSLKGSIYTLKDNYATKDAISRASSLILENFQPHYDATIRTLLDNAGATLIAKTNLDEFGLGGSGEYSAFGLIKHPKNDKHLVGGSSSGAAATFSDEITFAIGSDTGDSVRKPASNIGKVGFKPSYGAISRFGLFAFATSLDTVAYFTHNIYDAALLSSVLFKQDLEHDLSSVKVEFSAKKIKSVKPKTIAYLDCFDLLEKSVKKAYENLIKKLEKEGIKLAKIKPDETLLNSIDVLYKVIAFSEASSNLANLDGLKFGVQKEDKDWSQTFIKTRSEKLGKMVQSRLILGSYFLEHNNQIKYFLKAKKMRRYLANYFTEIHTKYDLFIYPASNDVAPLIGKEYKPSYMDFILTNSNLTGNPSITFKLGENEEKLPFNIACDGKIYEDQKLLNFALYIEEILGGKHD